MTRSLTALALTLFLPALFLAGLMPNAPRFGEVAAQVIPPPEEKAAAEADGKVVVGDDALVDKANKSISAAISFLKEQQSRRTGGWRWSARAACTVICSTAPTKWASATPCGCWGMSKGHS